MKEYCTDLKISEELKGNGFPQKSIWYWVFDNYNKKHFIQHKCLDDEDTLLYSAPTTDEILKELPVEINGFIFRIERIEHEFHIGYFELSYEDEVRFGLICDKKLSNALAKMWLYIKKEGYIK